MPELPEVETVRRGLTPVMEGKTIARVYLGRPDLRFAFPENFQRRLTGAQITRLGRRAKYLLIGLDTGETLLSHLGMSGSYLTLLPNQEPPEGHKTKHDHVVFTLEDGIRIIYNDPRRFGFMDLIAAEALDTHTFLNGLGPEPTGNTLSATDVANTLQKRRGPIKSALLDQRVIAGLGNIYVCEALYRSGIHPATRSCDLNAYQLDALVGHIRDVIQQAIEAGGSSLQDFSNADGELGYFQHRFEVYDRAGKPCLKPDCSGRIERMVQSGRSSFFCPACQQI